MQTDTEDSQPLAFIELPLQPTGKGVFDSLKGGKTVYPGFRFTGAFAALTDLRYKPLGCDRRKVSGWRHMVQAVVML